MAKTAQNNKTEHGHQFQNSIKIHVIPWRTGVLNVHGIIGKPHAFWAEK